MSEPTTSKRRIAASERQRQAVQMRLAGADYRTIGEALDMTPSGAYRSVKAALDTTREKTAEDAEQLRAIENRRLESMILAAMPQAKKGHLQAIETVRKLSESLRKLNGLDAPDKTDLTSGGKTISWRDFIDGNADTSSQ